MIFRKTNYNRTSQYVLIGIALCCFTGCSKPDPTLNTVAPDDSTPTVVTPVKFHDVAISSGIGYRWVVAGKRPLNILESIGNGCAFLDYNNDGNLDILLVGPQLALYKGDGKGHFVDVTHETGLDKFHGHFLGCAVGDYDGDGYDDIYISGFRTGLLLHNDHGKRFVDVTQSAGLKPQPWGTSCTFFQPYKNSPALDLFVANYADFSNKPGIPQLCTARGMQTSCAPRYYTPIKGVLYHNTGHGHFIDVSRTSGMDTLSGRGLGDAVAPIDASGRPFLAVANDEMASDLMKPLTSSGSPKYQNIGSISGIAFDRGGDIHGGMGTDWGDYDNDGKLDLFVATFQQESKSLYHNDGSDFFSDQAYGTGIAAATTPYVAFGCKFVDVNNDGWMDIAIANGHVQDNIKKIDPTTTYHQTPQLLMNSGGKVITFSDISSGVGPDFARRIVGRGLATGDFDNEGAEDILIVNSEGAPLLLHNDTKPSGHWLGIKLTGTTSNKDGIGAIVRLTAGGHTFTQLCHADGSYLSSSDLRVHFGLGATDKIDRITVTWPSGRVDTVPGPKVDRYVGITEGQGK